MEPQLPGFRLWFALVMNLLCFAAVPAFWYLADQGILPWNSADLRWSRLRTNPHVGARNIAADDFVTLIRGGCFGDCPDYGVTLYASGRVEFTGRSYVCEVGPRTSLVDARAATRLIADLRDTGFFDIDWHPTNDVSDAPEVRMQLSIGGRTKWIRDYHGDLSAPELLRRLENAIDGVAGTARWLPTRDPNRMGCPDGREPGD